MSEQSEPHRTETRSAAFEAEGGSALLFELAWEVCAQVGGIYTVLRSKAPYMVRHWGDSYCLIGPYRRTSAEIELEPQSPTGPVREAISELAHAGYGLYFGRWLVTGRPQVILVDLGSASSRLDQIKYFLWKDNGISAPGNDWEFDEVALFGHATTELLEAIQRHSGPQPIVAHFHEWQGAAALPMLKHRRSRIATVFTTHATLVGRSLSAANADLYGHLKFIDAGGVANKHGFASRHAMEGAAAASADVFTTVSSITAEESQQFLGRQADLVLPNGLNIERFAAPHEFQELHRLAKERIHEFVMGHFFPSYSFDLDRTLYVFTAGRYEYRNKGLDVFIEALHDLNQRMRADAASATVVAFIITRAPHRSFNVETLNRQAMLTELQETCAAVKEEMGRRLFFTVASGRLPRLEELISEYSNVRLKRLMHAWRGGHLPSIVTHNLEHDGTDSVLCHLRNRGLWNRPEDRVKVVFHPEFMSATSPLFGMEYDQFVRGCHLGVFPSYYEPWGYTPLECMVRGVPAITSDLAGFGTYLTQNVPDHDANGMYVARRRHVSFSDTVADVTDRMYDMTRMSRRERITLRNRVESRCELFDWNNLGRHYVEAHRLALSRRGWAERFLPIDAVRECLPRQTAEPPPTPERRRWSDARPGIGTDG